jgi:hypothetical protein
MYCLGPLSAQLPERNTGKKSDFSSEGDLLATILTSKSWRWIEELVELHFPKCSNKEKYIYHSGMKDLNLIFLSLVSTAHSKNQHDIIICFG